MNIKKQWQLVDDIFMDGDDCEGCMYRELTYPDLCQYSCELLDGYLGNITIRLDCVTIYVTILISTNHKGTTL